MTLFFIGIIEMLIVTAWTKLVSKTKVFSSGIVTLLNVLIWYYILKSIVEDINNWQLVLLYASGCVIGTILATLYFRYKENNQLDVSKP